MSSGVERVRSEPDVTAATPRPLSTPALDLEAGAATSRRVKRLFILVGLALTFGGWHAERPRSSGDLPVAEALSFEEPEGTPSFPLRATIPDARDTLPSEPPAAPIAPPAWAAAVERGQLIRLDEWLVTPSSSTSLEWSQARHDCARMKVGDVRGWRLPKMHELRALRRAKLVRAGTYWTATSVLVAGETQHWLLNVRSGEFEQAPLGVQAGMLCIRPTPSEF